MTRYPLSIRDIAPTANAIRLTGTRIDGLPDGYHTGGAWLVGDEVWKPLDGRPYANCPNHYSTLEDIALEEMADQPCFPRNWRVEECNGRRFLVRPKAIVITPKELLPSQALKIEQAVRSLNRAGWEIGDAISLGLCPVARQYFIMDLSNAHRMIRADDQWRIEALFKDADLDHLAHLRRNAHEALCGLEFAGNIPAGYGHIYASFSRPLNDWAYIPDAVYLYPSERPNKGAGIPHTWVVTSESLGAGILQRYELHWGWSPIREEA